MNINILDDVAISSNLDEGAQDDVCVYPLPCQLDNGELLCVYRRGREKHSLDGVLIAQRSTDGGANWSEQIIIYDGTHKKHPESVLTGALCQVPDGTVLAMFTTVDAEKPDVYIFSEEGRKLRQKLCVVRSNDGGKTWSTPEAQGAGRFFCPTGICLFRWKQPGSTASKLSSPPFYPMEARHSSP